MAELDLAKPFGAPEAIMRPDFSATPLPYGTLLELRCAISTALDLAALLPRQPDHAQDHGTWRHIWMRPNGWLLHHEQPAMAPDPAFVAGQAASRCNITDISHGRCAIRLAGDAVRDVLSSGTPLDLRASTFGPGRCARTICAGFSILLDHRKTHMMLYADASLSAAIWAWLDEAAQS